jgi:hypothetical protein
MTSESPCFFRGENKMRNWYKKQPKSGIPNKIGG